MLHFENLGLVALPAGLLLILAAYRRRALGRARALILIVFLGYLLAVVRETLFPIPVQLPERASLVIGQQVQLVPLAFLFSHDTQWHPQVTGNILLGVPFGVMLPLLKPLRWGVLLASAAFGLTIEVAQLVLLLLLPVPFRVADVDDVILNGLGVLAGYVVIVLLVTCRDRWRERRRGGHDPAPRSRSSGCRGAVIEPRSSRRL